MKVLGIVPARAGSTRLLGKNMKPIGGRPLVEWAIEAARAAGSITRLVVSSDDPEVLEVAERLAPGSGLDRPEDLATAESPAIDYVRHALEVAESDGARYDAVAIVQATSPFTTPQQIDDTIDLLRRTDADSAVTVIRLPHDLHPAKFKVLDGDRLRPYLEDEVGRLRFQDLPPVYVRSGSVYVSSRRTIDRGDLLGDDSRASIIPRTLAIDINDEADYLYACFLHEHHVTNRS